ncbi:MAG: response regulator [Candidatus Omnitrophota bacterium]
MAKKILVIDDELDILEVLSFRLEKAGYEIISAVNGKEALDILKKMIPDLILLDLRLPVIDGYEVCQRIKTDSKLKKIPVILLTASNVSKVEKTAKKFNVEGFIIKPFDYKDLIAKVEKFI